MSSNQHAHELSHGQLICDNEQCRKEVLDKIRGLKNDFDKIVSQQSSAKNTIDRKQAWKIIDLTTEQLSNKLTRLFNKAEIGEIIRKLMTQTQTKEEFDKAFENEKKRNSKGSISNEQLWTIYMHMCEDTIHTLSKTPNGQ